MSMMKVVNLHNAEVIYLLHRQRCQLPCVSRKGITLRFSEWLARDALI